MSTFKFYSCGGWSVVAALLVAGGMGLQCLQAQNVVNGDFETGTDLFVTWPGYVASGSNPAEIPGWTGTGGRGINPVVPGGATDAPFRDNGGNMTSIAFLQGTATLQQDVAGFSVGLPYVLSLDFNARNCCGDFPVASIALDGTVIASSSDLFPPPGAVIPVGGSNPWYHADIPFTAADSTLTLLIASAPSAGGDGTLLIDNISIVPEPSTAMLGLLGLIVMAGYGIKSARRK